MPARLPDRRSPSPLGLLVLLCAGALAACISESRAADQASPSEAAPAEIVFKLPEVSPPVPPPPVVPWGVVARAGGTVQRLWFGLTGDTRPGECDDTPNYPGAVITRIARSMKGLHVQFGLDLGDHMFVCHQSLPDAQKQMGEYMAALAEGPKTFWMTMGNHECGHLFRHGPCLPGDDDANYVTYMAALGRTLPFYAVDIHTSMGLARFVFLADDAWTVGQAEWAERVLADADLHARYTIVSRHHPMEGDRSGNQLVADAILRHKYSLILTGHIHTYQHDPDTLGGRTVILGVGGGPSFSQPGFGTILQNKDASLTFTMRDIDGHPMGATWSVLPQAPPAQPQ